MSSPKTNIVLIGMPGSGKSTVGIILAKIAGLAFVDTDILIQTETHRTLQAIIDHQGYAALRAIEERVILNLHVDHHVIATGGSAVYSSTAMNHLRQHGQVVLLDVDLATLTARVGDYSKRGIARRPDQSFSELLEERRALYQQHADLTVDCNRLSQESVVQAILSSLASVPSG